MICRLLVAIIYITGILICEYFVNSTVLLTKVISIVLPAVLTWLFAIPLRKIGWIKDGDLKLDL